jgi:hypothetical protein
VRRLLAIQAQDPRGARLAVRARSSGLRAADVDRAMSIDRTLLVTWLNRGTLHLVCAEDYRWLHMLTAGPQIAANARRLAREGVDANLAQRGATLIGRVLAEQGPLTRTQLREVLDRRGIPTAGQSFVHLLFEASLRGLLIRGPMLGTDHAFVHPREWLGEAMLPARDRALAELARRYLAGHAPAGDRDLAKWAGLPLRDARAGLAAIASALRERPDGLLELATTKAAGALPIPRLLGPFDPLLVGWASRDWIAGDHDRALMSVNGIIHAVALVDGLVAARWSLQKGALELAPFGVLSDESRAALAVEAREVAAFFG